MQTPNALLKHTNLKTQYQCLMLKGKESLGHVGHMSGTLPAAEGEAVPQCLQENKTIWVPTGKIKNGGGELRRL